MRNSDEFFDSADDIFAEDFGDDYQTDTDDIDDEPTEEPAEEPQQTDSEDDTEDEEETEDGAEDEEEPTSDSEDDDSGDGEGEDGDGKTDPGETFTLKVNKEEKQVSREEVITLAQKGMDYDRVKEQSAKHQQTITDLQARLEGLSKHEDALGIFAEIAKDSDMTLDQMAEALFVSMRKNAGDSEETAQEKLKVVKLQRELDGHKAKQEKQQKQEGDADARLKRDLADFRSEYPDVELTKELVDKLAPDIQNKMSLSAAYRKYEKAQDAERIAALERQVAAKAQNKKNKAKAVGSKRDSGAGSSPDLADIFERELFK